MDSLGGHRHDNQSYYFKEAITWSLTNSSYFGARFRPAGSIFDVNGMSMFVSKQFDLHYLLGFMCSKISSSFMKINNPTLASQVGDVSRLPIIYSEDKLSKVSVLVNECIDYAKTDWDSYETSWDFKRHPLINYSYHSDNPMLDSKTGKTYQRNKAMYDTEPVEVGLLSASRKISNMIFSLNFYQKDAVGDNRSAANYLLYFVDSNGKQISDTAKIIADKTSVNGQERTFRCSFNLKSLKYDNKASYYLLIKNESGQETPQKEEFQIDIAFAVEEFDFLS